MSKRYIPQVNETNFIYPNNTEQEYDVNIIHDINDNCVSGTVTNFSATTVSSTGITFTYSTTWDLNNAEPWIRNSNVLGIYSIHMLAPGQNYYKPWRLVQSRASSTTNLTTFSETNVTFSVTPSQVGVSAFTNGTYYFEVRFIGHRCIFPVCVQLNISTITPPPTPTPTATPTMTPTPTPTPTTPPVCCKSGTTINVTDTGWIKFTLCDGTVQYREYTTTGSKTITDCIQQNSVMVGIPFADLAAFTVTSQGTNCGGSCLEPTPTPVPGSVNLQIYANDVDPARAIITMFYNINGGSNINIPGATATRLPAACSSIYTITGLSSSDVVTFGTSISCVMTGTSGFSCPASISTSTTYSYIVDAPTTQAVAITVDTGYIP